MSDLSTKSAIGLGGDLLQQVTDLFRKELHLLRAELSEKLGQVGIALGLLVAGVIFALTAINVLAGALVAAAAAIGIPGGWAALIVGMAIALGAYLLIQQGLGKLKATRLKPERTLRSLRLAADGIEETVK